MNVWIVSYSDWDDYRILGIYHSWEEAHRQLERVAAYEKYAENDDGVWLYPGDLQIDEYQCDIDAAFPFSRSRTIRLRQRDGTDRRPETGND